MNKVFLKGNVERPADVRTLPSGDFVCNFAVTTKRAGHIESHKIVSFKSAAETAKSLQKDDLVFIEAFIQSRELISEAEKVKKVAPRRVKEIIAEKIHLVERSARIAEMQLAPAEMEAVNQLHTSNLPNFI